MTRGADQIALPLDWPQADRASRYLVGTSNRGVFDHFQQWSLWPVKATILTGPRRSGRSLLASGFVEKVGGRLFDPAEGHDDEVLFHAWNQAQDSKRPAVFIYDEVPSPDAIKLPDLRTRLAVTPIVTVPPPDDALFESLIQLLFADRGLHLGHESLRFLSERVERSYWNAERIVEAIDRFAIAERARLTLPTIRRALSAAGIIDERGAA